MKYGINLWFEKGESVEESMEETRNKVTDALYGKISDELKESITNYVSSVNHEDVIRNEDGIEILEYVYDLSKFLDELKENQEKNIRYV